MENEPTDAGEPLALFWDAILSRQTTRIQSAYNSLDPSSRRALLVHLRRMVTEEGWQAEQVLSAQTALEAIRALDKPD